MFIILLVIIVLNFLYEQATKSNPLFEDLDSDEEEEEEDEDEHQPEDRKAEVNAAEEQSTIIIKLKYIRLYCLRCFYL